MYRLLEWGYGIASSYTTIPCDFVKTTVKCANQKQIEQCLSKWAESPPWGQFWWARGRKCL